MLGRMYSMGLILAVWTAAAWFIIPTGKFVHWLASSPQLGEFRPRAIATSLALIAAGLVLLGIIPMPDHRRAYGVVESVQRSGVFFGSDGFIATAHAHVGDRVRAGDPIVTMENPDLLQRLARAEAELAEAEASERQHMTEHAALAQIDRENIGTRQKLIAALHERVEMLVVRAPHDGVVVPGLRGADPFSVVGSYARRGQGLCEVVNTAQTRITASLSTAEAAPLLELPE